MAISTNLDSLLTVNSAFGLVDQCDTILGLHRFNRNATASKFYLTAMILAHKAHTDNFTAINNDNIIDFNYRTNVYFGLV